MASDSAPSQLWETMDKRVAALEAESGALSTMFRYGHSLDSGAGPAWVDCFTQDGTLEVRNRQGASRRAEGSAALTQFIAGHAAAASPHRQHLLLNPIVTVNGDEAASRSYIVTFIERDVTPTIGVFASYLDRLVKCPDGVWRIKERHIEQEAGQPARKIG